MKEWKPSRTARAVAAERAVLHDLGIIDDPFAATMLRGGMRSAHRMLRRLPPRTWSRSVTLAGLAGRVRWFDQQVTDAIDADITQIVTVGAGYDSRPWRFATDGVRFLEVDHPATQGDKRQVAPDHGVEFLTADLIDDDLLPALAASPYDPSVPALFVVEGVTMYLDEAVVRRQLAALATASAPGSRLAVDFFPASPPDAGADRRQLLLQRVARIGSNEGFRLGVDRARAVDLVVDCGWTVTSVVTAREAASTLVGQRAGVPTERVTGTKTFVAAAARPGAGRHET